jgi:cellulose synthase/poly-beta-1,6-N-acetylglucosamine synthase-like glycosyltransferase
MIVFEIIAFILLVVMIFWVGYNGYILVIGVRKRQTNRAINILNLKHFPKISIIVPTKDDENVIGRCLESILKIDYPKDKMEVIVVEGNSKDTTCKICKEYAEKNPETLKVISEKTAKGKPAALNLALRQTTGEIIGVFDADSIPNEDVLKKTAAYFSDQKIMAIQGETHSVNEKDNVLTRVTAMEEKAWYQALINGREKLQLFVPLNGSNQFVRKQVLEELGGWDENSLTEDVELALRLVEKQHEIKYAPDVCAGQETPNSLRSLFHQRLRWYRGYMETAFKYGRLMNNLNRKTLDAEISLFGPFTMICSFLSYINWGCLILFPGTGSMLDLTDLAIILTAISLISLGIASAAAEKPIKAHNLLWIPSIYVYWFMQTIFAFWAFLTMLFRRQRVWSKTAKNGSISISPKMIQA